MSKDRPTGKRNIFIFLIVSLSACVYCLWHLAHFGNTPEVFDDVVTGNLGIDGTNKSEEFRLLWILLFGGSALYLILSVITERCFAKEKPADAQAMRMPPLTFSGVCILAVIGSVVLKFVMYQTINSQMILGLIVLVFATLIKSPRIGETFVAYFLLNMGLLGLYYPLVLIGLRVEPGNDFFSIAAAVLSCILSCIDKRKEGGLKRGILTAQAVMAGVLGYLLIDTYLWQQNYITIRPATGVILAVVFAMALTATEAALKIGKYWNASSSLKQILTISGSVLTFTWLQLTGDGAVVRDDLRHPYECVIGFFQVFVKGQKLYEEYSPTSGLFSLLQGGFLELLGEGKISNYNTVNTIFYLVIFTLLVLALRLHFSAEYVLLIAMFFSVNTRLENYNRYIFVLPITLLLLYRPLVKKRVLWLWCWILTTLVHGLYYPLLGAAVGAGFAPMGLWILYRHIVSGDLKKDLKKPVFWAGWLVTITVVAVSIPLLLGMADHILAMAGQTVLADGICMFGENVPTNFFAYLSNSNYSFVRIVIYNSIRFVGLPVFGYTGIALFYAAVKGRSIKELLQNETVGYRAAFCLYLCIMPPIAYTYTFCRSEAGEIFSRGDHITYVLGILFILYALRYVRQRRWQYALLLLGFLTPCLTNTLGLEHQPAVLAFFRPPKDAVYVSQDSILPRLGDCFINGDTYKQSVNYMDKLMLEGADEKDDAVFALGNRYVYTFLGNVRGAATIESTVAFSYNAAENTANTLRTHPSYADIADNSLSNYYLYHWIVTSGRYVWKPRTELFAPVSIEQQKEDISLSPDLVLIKNGQGMAQRFGDLNMQAIADSWGSSMASLEQVFTEGEVPDYTIRDLGHSIEIEFDEQFDGDCADFIYLEFGDIKNSSTSYYMGHHLTSNVFFVSDVPPAKKAFMRHRKNVGHTVYVTFKDDYGKEHSVFGAMGDGKMLICLGSCGGWLLNGHDKLIIEHYMNDIQKPVPEDVTVRFLKLREIQP